MLRTHTSAYYSTAHSAHNSKIIIRYFRFLDFGFGIFDFYFLPAKKRILIKIKNV
jgi:hypothetical protein